MKPASKATRLAAACERVGRFLDRLAGWLLAVSALLLLAMMVLMGIEIASRGLLKTSTQIADEYTGYLFTAMTVFCFVYAQRADKFLRVDALRDRWSPRKRAAADAAASFLAGALTAVLIYATWSMTKASFEFNALSIQPSQTRLFLPQGVMPIALSVLLIGFVQSAVQSLLQAMGHMPIANKAPQEALHE